MTIVSPSDLVMRSAEFLVKFINSLTETDQYRPLCEPFSLKSVDRASVMAPKKGE